MKVDIDECIDYIQRYLSVQRRDAAGTMPAMLLPTQLKLLRDAPAARLERDISVVVKPRQIGSSTLWLLLVFTFLVKFPGISILWVNLDEDGAKEIREKFTVIASSAEDMPGSGHPGKSKDNEDEFRLSNGSRVVWAVAGKKMDTAVNVGRGGTFHFVVYCEFAYWLYAKETLDSLAPALEHSDPSVIVDSTPNGVTGPGATYHKMAQAARRGEPGYTLCFYPWWDEPGYRDRLLPEERDYILATLSEEEEIMVEAAREQGVVLDPEQVSWWRRMRDKHEEKVYEIYPFRFDDAFVKPGLCVFDEHVMRAYQRRAANEDFPVGLLPAQVAIFVGTRGPLMGGDLLLTPRWGASDIRRGYTRVYQAPQGGTRYFVGVDGSSGGRSGDWQCATLVDDKMNIVATMRMRVPVTQFAGYVQRLATAYDAYVLIESEKYGRAIHQRISEPVPDSVAEAYNAGPGLCPPYQKFVDGGLFDTNTKTRPLLVQLLIDTIDNGLVDLVDKELFLEASDFREDDKGKVGHSPGSHDDGLFSLAIACHARNLIVGTGRARKTPPTMRTPDAQGHYDYLQDRPAGLHRTGQKGPAQAGAARENQGSFAHGLAGKQKQALRVRRRRSRKYLG